MAGAIVPTLGKMFTIMIDPLWPYKTYWKSPIGQIMSAIFFDQNETLFTETAGVTYTQPDIMGRSEPLQVWMGTNAREITFTFKFHLQGPLGTDFGVTAGGSNLTGINPNQLRKDPNLSNSATIDMESLIDKEVLQPAKFLQALVYPITDEQGIAHGPPPVRITIGRLLAMRAIVSDVQVTWETPVETDNYLPHSASVQVTFLATHRVVNNFNFDGPWRFDGNGDTTVTDGPANPFSSLGTGFSGAGNNTGNSTPA